MGKKANSAEKRKEIDRKYNLAEIEQEVKNYLEGESEGADTNAKKNKED